MHTVFFLKLWFQLRNNLKLNNNIKVLILQIVCKLVIKVILFQKLSKKYLFLSSYFNLITFQQDLFCQCVSLFSLMQFMQHTFRRLTYNTPLLLATHITIYSDDKISLFYTLLLFYTHSLARREDKSDTKMPAGCVERAIKSGSADCPNLSVD